jgi:hypothetical protein
MATRLFSRPVPLILIALLLFLTMPVAAMPVAASPLAQEAPDDSPGIDTTEPVPPVEPPLVNPSAEGEEEIQVAAPAAIEALPAATMNYQGVLKDEDGARLTGNYAMTFRLFNAATLGAKVWGDEIHPIVPVRDGLFQVVLGAITPFDVNNDFDEQLYLEVQVGAVKLPRLPLRAAPYAMGLVGGATVKADTTAETAYALEVDNVGGRGLWVGAKDNGRYGLYNADVTYSSEGYAGPDSYQWLPVLNGIIEYDDRLEGHVAAQNYGHINIVPDAPPGTVNVQVPIAYERPYGRDYKLVGVTVYYKTTNANGFINNTWVVGRNFSTGATAVLISDATNRTSTSYANYTVEPASPVTISTTDMPTSLKLQIQFNGAAVVTLYGARLRWQSTP